MDQQWALREGMTVYGADGDKVGKVIEVGSTYITVEKGFFFPTDYYIPTSAVASVGDDDVYLTVTKDEALNQAWDQLPAADYATDTAYDRPVTSAADATLADTTTGAEQVRVPVYEEEVTPVKRPVERGAVRIEKEVVTEDRTVTVPVTEERVQVSRVDVDTPGAVGPDAFEEGAIEVPVRGEEIELEKTARQTGEVVVEKEPVRRTERVGDTVRREEVHVDDATVAGTVDEETGRPSTP